MHPAVSIPKTATRRTVEQTGIVVSSYALAQPFGVFVAGWLQDRGIPMPEPVATGAILALCSVVGRLVIAWWQSRVWVKP